MNGSSSGIILTQTTSCISPKKNRILVHGRIHGIDDFYTKARSLVLKHKIIRHSPVVGRRTELRIEHPYDYVSFASCHCLNLA